jgi:hypothetical protein
MAILVDPQRMLFGVWKPHTKLSTCRSQRVTSRREVVEPGKKPFDLPAAARTTDTPAILGDRPTPASVRGDHLIPLVVISFWSSASLS